MTAHGVGNLVRIDSTLNAELYCGILDEHLAASVEIHWQILSFNKIMILSIRPNWLNNGLLTMK